MFTFLTPALVFRPLEVGDMTGLEPSIEESDTSIDPVQETIDPVQETVDLCSELDSCCVITGSSLAIVTLIVPFNYDGSDEDLEYTKSLAPALSAIIDNPNGEEPLEHLKTLYKHQGCTYKPWNAIFINRDLQQLWTSGLCALKWLNAVALPEDPSKSRIRLQFHWLYPKDSIRRPMYPCRMIKRLATTFTPPTTFISVHETTSQGDRSNLEIFVPSSASLKISTNASRCSTSSGQSAMLLANRDLLQTLILTRKWSGTWKLRSFPARMTNGKSPMDRSVLERW